MKDYYYILGVSRNASEEDIKKAYRKLSLKFHPDQNNNDKYWEERFKDINEAYETLVDYTKRRRYDESFEQESNGETFTPPPPPQTPPSPKPSLLKQIINGVLNVIGFLFIFGVIIEVVNIGKGFISSHKGDSSSVQTPSEANNGASLQEQSRTFNISRIKYKFYNRNLHLWDDWPADWRYLAGGKDRKIKIVKLDAQGSKFKIENPDSTTDQLTVVFRGYNSKYDWNEYVAENGDEFDVKHTTLNSFVQDGFDNNNFEIYLYLYSKDIAVEFQ